MLFILPFHDLSLVSLFTLLVSLNTVQPDSFRQTLDLIRTPFELFILPFFSLLSLCKCLLFFTLFIFTYLFFNVWILGSCKIFINKKDRTLFHNTSPSIKPFIRVRNLLFLTLLVFSLPLMFVVTKGSVQNDTVGRDEFSSLPVVEKDKEGLISHGTTYFNWANMKVSTCTSPQISQGDP